MKLYLAPFMAITTTEYRNAFVDIFGGIDAVYAPFIATTHMRKKNSTLFEDIRLDTNTNKVPLIPQLLSNTSTDFKFFASTMVHMGHTEINWNIGCPYPTVTKKQKGSGILPYPNLVRDFLEKICEQQNYNLSVKMRLGLNHYEEGLRIMEVLNDFPLASVTIHGRLGKQLYEGVVNVDAFEALYNISKHPVIYNGDILTIDDFKRIQTRFPNVEGYMLGRGALRNPFLPSEIKGISLSNDEKMAKLVAFHHRMYKHYASVYSNEQFLCGQLKKFWDYTGHALIQKDEFLKEIRLCSSVAQYLGICDKYLGS